MNCSDTNATDRNAAEQRIRATGTHPELSWVKHARDMKTANPLMAFATVALNLQTDLGIKVDGRRVKEALGALDITSSQLALVTSE